jgi:hypothetical protein
VLLVIQVFLPIFRALDMLCEYSYHLLANPGDLFLIITKKGPLNLEIGNGSFNQKVFEKIFGLYTLVIIEGIAQTTGFALFWPQPIHQKLAGQGLFQANHIGL